MRPGRPVSPGPDGPIYDNFIPGGSDGAAGGFGGGYAPNRPFGTRCDEGEGFKQLGTHQRMRKQYVKIGLYAPSLRECEKECTEARDFICRSFNFK